MPYANWYIYIYIYRYIHNILAILLPSIAVFIRFGSSDDRDEVLRIGILLLLLLVSCSHGKDRKRRAEKMSVCREGNIPNAYS